MPFIQIYGGGFALADGDPIANGTIYFTLPQAATVASTFQICPQVVSFSLDDTGNVPQSENAKIWGTDSLTPSGLTYSVSVKDSTGCLVYGPINASIAGASPLNLSTLTPASSSVSYPGAVLLDPSGNQIIDAFGLTVSEFNNIVYVDGTVYPYTAAGIQAAINAACNGTTPGKVIIGPNPGGTAITVNSSLTVPSLCSIEGPGSALLTFEADAVTAPVMLLNGVSNVYLSGFSLDGNRNNNTSGGGMLIEGNCTDIHIDDVRFTNAYANGCAIVGTGQRMFFNNCDFSNSGVPLSVGNGQGSGFALTPSGTCSHIQITRSRIHGNSLGIIAFNPSSAGTFLEDFLISECQVFSNACDGISINDNFAAGGKVLGLRIENCETYSNGWTANGAGLPSNFIAGLLQTGSTAGSSGCGIDILSNHNNISQCMIVGCRSHENIFDAFAIAGALGGTVNTSGTAVTWVSGDKFSTAWKAGQQIFINNVFYQLASTPTATSATLTSTAGTQTGVGYTGSAATYSTVADCIAWNNGAAGVGTGLWNFFSDYNVWSGCIAMNSYVEGAVIDGSYQVVHLGSKLFGNNTSGGIRPYGARLFGAVDCQMIGCVTNDVPTAPTQTTGIAIQSPCVNTVIQGGSILGSSANISDSGTNTSTTIALNNIPAVVGLTATGVTTPIVLLDGSNNVNIKGCSLTNAIFIQPDGTDVTAFFNATSLTLQSGVNLGVGGKISSYNGVSTTNGGVPATIANSSLTGLSAAVTNHSLFTPASTGLYRITWQAKVTQAATSSSTLGGSTGFSVKYTDAFDSTASVVNSAGSGGTSAGNALTTATSGQILINALTSVAVTFSYGYTSSGGTAMNYYIQVLVEQM